MIVKQYSDYFFNEDELYPMQNYEGRPNEELFDRTNYNVQEGDEYPSITFASTMAPLELPPVHRDYRTDYQMFHWDLERWAIFRALPAVVKMARDWDKFYHDVQTGYLDLPQ